MARSGIAREEVERSSPARCPRTERLRAADIVIFNAGACQEQIAGEVRQIARRFGL